MSLFFSSIFCFVASVCELKNLEIAADDDNPPPATATNTVGPRAQQRDKATDKSLRHRRNNAQTVMTSSQSLLSDANHVSQKHKNNAQTLSAVQSTYTQLSRPATTTTASSYAQQYARTANAKTNLNRASEGIV